MLCVQWSVAYLFTIPIGISQARMSLLSLTSQMFPAAQALDAIPILILPHSGNHYSRAGQARRFPIIPV